VDLPVGIKLHFHLVHLFSLFINSKFDCFISAHPSNFSTYEYYLLFVHSPTMHIFFYYLNIVIFFTCSFQLHNEGLYSNQRTIEQIQKGNFCLLQKWSFTAYKLIYSKRITFSNIFVNFGPKS